MFMLCYVYVVTWLCFVLFMFCNVHFDVFLFCYVYGLLCLCFVMFVMGLLCYSDDTMRICKE